MKSKTFLTITLGLFLSVGHTIHADVLIPDKELEDRDIIATKPIVAFRAFPEMLIYYTDVKNNESGLPAAVIKGAANRISDLRADLELNHPGWDNSYDEKFRQSIGYMEGWSTRNYGAEIGLYKPGMAIGHLDDLVGLKAKGYQYGYGDYELSEQASITEAKFMTQLLGTELFSGDFWTYTEHQTSPIPRNVELVRVNSEVANVFSESYGEIRIVGSYKPFLVNEKFNYVANKLSKYPQLAKVAKIYIPEISFGRPIVFPAAEKNLQLPDTITRQFDVYWVELAYSNRELSDKIFEEINYTVKFDDDVIALEIAPLQYGIVHEVLEKRSTPEIKLGVGNKYLNLGEFYSQTIYYESMKPVVVASGLQENSVIWTLRGDATGFGAKRFIVILATPVGATELKIELAANVRMDGWLGIQGDIGATDIVTHVEYLR